MQILREKEQEEGRKDGRRDKN